MAMMQEHPNDSALSVRDSSSVCPHRCAIAAPSARSIASPPVRFISIQQFVSQSDRIVQVLASARISEARSHLKRGPPSRA